MKKESKNPSNGNRKKLRPALNPEQRENQLISLAIDLAEQQLLDGTASSQVITHYLKLGTMKEKLEREKLEKENELLRVKTKAIESAESSEKIYKEAIAAFRLYNGVKEPIDENI